VVACLQRLPLLKNVKEHDMANFPGTAGSDVLTGTALDDQINGFGGNDFMIGGPDVDAPSGNDNMDGGSGNDAIYGFDGNDMLFGGDGNDSGVQLMRVSLAVPVMTSLMAALAMIYSTVVQATTRPCTPGLNPNMTFKGCRTVPFR
jgi:hypothetical protein